MASGPKTLKPMPVKTVLKKGEYPGVPVKHGKTGGSKAV